MTLKLWALLYQLTGWYSPWARVAEYEALCAYLETEEADQLLEKHKARLVVSLFKGSWQSEHGFYR